MGLYNIEVIKTLKVAKTGNCNSNQNYHLMYLRYLWEVFLRLLCILCIQHICCSCCLVKFDFLKLVQTYSICSRFLQLSKLLSLSKHVQTCSYLSKLVFFKLFKLLYNLKSFSASWCLSCTASWDSFSILLILF